MNNGAILAGKEVWDTSARLVEGFCKRQRSKRANELKQHSMLFQKVVCYFEKIAITCTAPVRWTASESKPFFLPSLENEKLIFISLVQLEVRGLFLGDMLKSKVVPL